MRNQVLWCSNAALNIKSKCWWGAALGDVRHKVIANPDADRYWTSSINGPYRFYWGRNIRGCGYLSDGGPVLIKMGVQYQWVSGQLRSLKVD